MEDKLEGRLHKKEEINRPLLKIYIVSGILLLSDLVLVYASFYFAMTMRRWLIPWLGGQVY